MGMTSVKMLKKINQMLGILAGSESCYNLVQVQFFYF